ncbi:MAG: tRNA (adenine-N1)-methyltransferase [Deltaproteobacteria bacterium]|nr:tRNA (adenine-N1)-methyltransferase [Deltaproteobacteria bacterium]
MSTRWVTTAGVALQGATIPDSNKSHGLRATGEPLRDGDSVVFFDRKDREYLKTLRAGETISIRGGTIAVDDLLGRPDGFSVRSSLRERFVVLRPTLERLIPNLPRKAQVIYPKDLALILMWGDVYPGATVVEAGVGPGALTLALLRAVGPEGRVISFETREEHARAAERNVARYYGAAPQWTLEVADVADGLRELTVDRVFLDLPEPWRHTDLAWRALRPGGVFLGYVPTVLQVKGFVDSLKDHGGFACIDTMETLVRYWHVKEMSVRPQHRMVAHTGFVTTARRVEMMEGPERQGPADQAE